MQYDGDLLLLTSWSGAITGSVARAYNNNFFLTSESVDGGDTVNFGYDADGLVTTMGGLTLTRDAPNGLVTDTTLGSITDHSTYNAFAEVRDYVARYSGSSIYHRVYQTRDVYGRVETKVKTIGGETTTYVYGYDMLGRLTQVLKNGALVASYDYDANGNRTAGPGLTTAPTYDSQDRLLIYGDWAFTYSASGDLLTKTNTTTGAARATTTTA